MLRGRTISDLIIDKHNEFDGFIKNKIMPKWNSMRCGSRVFEVKAKNDEKRAISNVSYVNKYE